MYYITTNCEDLFITVEYKLKILDGWFLLIYDYNYGNMLRPKNLELNYRIHNYLHLFKFIRLL